jgi:hypothetical protein
MWLLLSKALQTLLLLLLRLQTKQAAWRTATQILLPRAGRGSLLSLCLCLRLLLRLQRPQHMVKGRI